MSMIMHCSSCGKAIIQGVSYCTGCGTRAAETPERAANKLSESSFNILLVGVLGIPIAGLGIIIGLMDVMKEIGFNNGLIIAFTSLAFLLLLIAESVFLWLLLQNRARTEKERGVNARAKEVEVKEIGEGQFGQITEPPVSATENTTQSFAPIHREPQKRR